MRAVGSMVLSSLPMATLSCMESAAARPAIATANGGATGGLAMVRGAKRCAGGIVSPFDAAPGPDGSVIYVTAAGEREEGSLLEVAADQAEPFELASGFRWPAGVAVEADGSRIFVSDRGDGGDDRGAIYSIRRGGGPQVALGRTRGMRPRTLAVVETPAGEAIDFVATDPDSGECGLFRISTSGGVPVARASSAMLCDATAIAVRSDGAAYVARGAGNREGPGVVQVDREGVQALLLGLYASGLALSTDEQLLFVSGVDAANRAVLYQVSLSGIAIETLLVEANATPRGIRRAPGSGTFAWVTIDGAPNADGERGTVQVFELVAPGPRP